MQEEVTIAKTAFLWGDSLMKRVQDCIVRQLTGSFRIHSIYEHMHAAELYRHVLRNSLAARIYTYKYLRASCAGFYVNSDTSRYLFLTSCDHHEHNYPSGVGLHAHLDPYFARIRPDQHGVH